MNLFAGETAVMSREETGNGGRMEREEGLVEEKRRFRAFIAVSFRTLHDVLSRTEKRKGVFDNSSTDKVGNSTIRSSSSVKRDSAF